MHTHISGHPGYITQCLHHWSIGNRDAENQLFEAVLPNLRRLAHYLIKGERSRGCPLEPTDLVNQIYCRLAAARKRNWQNRKHFFSFAARSMRWYLIECARARRNAQFVAVEEIEDSLPCDSANLELLFSVRRLLDQLADTNPDWCIVVDLKYFLGLTDVEAAETMGVKLRTMQRMWADARQWLFDRAGSLKYLTGARTICTGGRNDRCRGDRDSTVGASSSPEGGASPSTEAMPSGASVGA